MSSLDDIRKGRIKKAEKLRRAGIDPYPSNTKRQYSLSYVANNFEKLTSLKDPISVAGRVMSLRPQGGLIFFHLYDGSQRFQGLLKKEEVGDRLFDYFFEVTDVGDFVEISGTLFITKRGEKTVLVSDWNILSKSLRSLPDKWHGLQDADERFRRRYLDILFNPEVRELIEKKAVFWQSVRNFLIDRNFLEVETPVLETTTGGADARPFVTHHNALDMDVYLRISAGELWQKMLMVAGFERTFEIGRIFRNEGMSSEHAQDYTQMECYSAYTSYGEGMKFVTDLYRHLAQETFGTLQFRTNNHEIDLGKTWEEYDYVQTIKKITDLDVSRADLKTIEVKLKELKVDYEKKGLNKMRATDLLWKYCRKQIAGPGFLVGIPTELSPLAKKDSKDPDRAQKFHVLLGGSEVGTGYSELNDPLDQAERFSVQEGLREKGDEEAQMYNHEFVEALEYGMPPTFGFGLSERLFSFLADKPIREVQIFPLMKPRSNKD